MTRKTAFFEGWSWFKFNNLRLTLGTNLKFYTSVAKGLKLKVRKFWGLIPTFIEVTGEKLVGGPFCPLPPLFLLPPSPILNRVKSHFAKSKNSCSPQERCQRTRIQATATVWVQRIRTRQRHIQKLVKHLRWMFCEKSKRLKAVNYISAKHEIFDVW